MLAGSAAQGGHKSRKWTEWSRKCACWFALVSEKNSKTEYIYFKHKFKMMLRIRIVGGSGNKQTSYTTPPRLREH